MPHAQLNMIRIAYCFNLVRLGFIKRVMPKQELRILAQAWSLPNTLDVTASTWECHEKSASRWSPNSLNEFTRSIWPSVHCIKGKLEDSVTGPMTISFVLVKLTAVSLIVDQFSNNWKKCCMLEDSFRPCSNSVSVVSSTYFEPGSWCICQSTLTTRISIHSKSEHHIVHCRPVTITFRIIVL